MSCADFEPKLIYLARRQPTLTRAEFRDRWRRHGALGMSRPRWKNISQYVHCDVLDDSGYDGIGLIWHRSPAHRAAHLADTSSRLDMERDEQETFSRPIVEDCLLAREHVIQPVATRWGSAARLFLFLADLPTSTDSALAAATGRAQRLQSAALTPRGQLLDVALPPERPPRWGLPYPQIEEWRFDDHADALAAANVLGDSAALAVITNEVPLYWSR
jgi:hypothetical protein